MEEIGKYITILIFIQVTIWKNREDIEDIEDRRILKIFLIVRYRKYGEYGGNIIFYPGNNMGEIGKIWRIWRKYNILSR